MVWLTSHDTVPSTDHDLWLWLFLDHYDTFPSSGCDGQAMIFNCGSTWTIMIPSLPASVMYRPWYVPFHQIWWTGHDLWLWLFLDHYDTFPSSWCDGQAMICDCSSSWIIMIPSLLAGVMDRPWSVIAGLPGSYNTFSSNWCDVQAIICDCCSS